MHILIKLTASKRRINVAHPYPVKMIPFEIPLGQNHLAEFTCRGRAAFSRISTLTVTLIQDLTLLVILPGTSNQFTLQIKVPTSQS
jgi:hypothetical protein